MAVKKAKDASFKRMDSAYASSKSAIQKVKNADPLNAKEEQEQEEGNASVDPANYLSKKEKKDWKRLSYTAKQRYIRQAERQLKRQKKRNGIAKTEQSSVQEKEQQAAEIFLKERKYKSNTWKEPVDKKRSAAMTEMERSHLSRETAGRLSVPRVRLPEEKRQQILRLLLQQKQQKLQEVLQQKQQIPQPHLRVLGWLHWSQKKRQKISKKCCSRKIQQSKARG